MTTVMKVKASGLQACGEDQRLYNYIAIKSENSYTPDVALAFQQN
jgi:hypothetical protein